MWCVGGACLSVLSFGLVVMMMAGPASGCCSSFFGRPRKSDLFPPPRPCVAWWLVTRMPSPSKLDTVRAGGFSAVPAWNAHPRSLLALLRCSTFLYLPLSLCFFLVLIVVCFACWKKQPHITRKREGTPPHPPGSSHAARQACSLVPKGHVAPEETRVLGTRERFLGRRSFRQPRSPDDT